MCVNILSWWRVRAALLPVACCVALPQAYSAEVTGVYHFWHAQISLSSKRPEPQSRAFLSLILLDKLKPVRKRSGQMIKFLDHLPIAEFPDYDPLKDMDRLRVSFSQSAGVPVTISDANSIRASAVLPSVEVPSEFTFDILVANASGEKRGRLMVTVSPGP